ncbi:ABC transporter permease subunit [Sediminibacillus dalangtanensis]|uniref:ABC transporter permease subunit n=1 Tax=Sediminibacillus dalangtanensis TaxID=2729421 RepID=A0ABX7VPQ8_9BACI|nr:ABC transporter permease [Sediminibacillus dalangtanensis]QTM98468.1 ABC transporter permease subunit [Sediminibacillus dalangtanensis]
MKSLVIELKKQRRAGVIEVLILGGIAGSVYSVMNWFVRKEFFLTADNPMSTLLTQLYGVIILMNIFAIIVSANNIYHMEFQYKGINKIRTLPIKISAIFTSKLIILIFTLFLAYTMEYITLAILGNHFIPTGSFDLSTLFKFAVYSFLIAVPSLTFMLIISMLFTNMWVTIGIGVVGFFSGMSMVNGDSIVSLANPFVLILKPAVSLSSDVDVSILLISVVESFVFVIVGSMIANKKMYE